MVISCHSRYSHEQFRDRNEPFRKSYHFKYKTLLITARTLWTKLACILVFVLQILFVRPAPLEQQAAFYIKTGFTSYIEEKLTLSGCFLTNNRSVLQLSQGVISEQGGSWVRFFRPVLRLFHLISLKTWTLFRMTELLLQGYVQN